MRSLTNKIKKVIYIGYAPLTVKTEKDFYFNELQEEDIGIEYWDLTTIFFPRQIFVDEQEQSYITKISTLNELKKKLKNEDIDSALFMSIIGYEWRSLHLHYILRNSNCRIGFFARGMLPVYSVNLKSKLLFKLRHSLSVKNVFRFSLNLLAYFLRKKTSVGHYEVVFSAGNIAKNIYQNFTPNIISCNHFDYDYTLQLENIPVPTKKYVLFLDEFLSGHPDFKMQNAKTISEENYFAQMNAFFSKIEKTFDLKVIIASHPKADYDPNTFDGREIIKYKTAELARDAEFFIAHISTSIGFATIYNKPLLLTYTQELQDVNPGYVNYINAFGKTLNCNAIKINDILHQTDTNVLTELIKKIDRTQYRNYLFNYLTSEESKDVQTSTIFLNYLKRTRSNLEKKEN